MYRVNVSPFLKAQGYALLDEFLRIRLVPLPRGDEDVTQVDLLEVIAQTPVVEMVQPMDGIVLALFISLEQERDLEHYLSGIPGERSGLLDKTFGKHALYHVTSTREIAL